MRTALAALVLLPALSHAQGISGSLTAVFEGFSEFGVPQTRLTLSLTCTLACTSAPGFGVSSTDGYFLGEPTEKTGYVSPSFGLDPSGRTEVLSDQFKPGTAFLVRARSASCRCGSLSATPITLESAPVLIPPLVTEGFLTVGDPFSSVLVTATPKGSESVVVRLTGAGLDETRTLGPADFSNGTSFVRFTPTQPGALTVTATLQPHGAARTVSFTATGTGGTTGGGTGATGGGSGGSGGGGADAPGGCSSASGLVVAGLGLLLRRYRSTR